MQRMSWETLVPKRYQSKNVPLRIVFCISVFAGRPEAFAQPRQLPYSV
jgi:hypothetical protein